MIEKRVSTASGGELLSEETKMMRRKKGGKKRKKKHRKIDKTDTTVDNTMLENRVRHACVMYLMNIENHRPDTWTFRKG